MQTTLNLNPLKHLLLNLILSSSKGVTRHAYRYCVPTGNFVISAKKMILVTVIIRVVHVQLYYFGLTTAVVRP